MASVRSGTGDIKNNLMKLLREVQRMKLQIEPNIQGMSLGAPSAFLPVLHASLMHYSLPFANWLTRNDYELYGKNDLRFLEGLYKVLRDVFHYHPQLTREQFLSTGFAERKILLTTDVLCFCQTKHRELTGRRPGRRGGRRRVSASSKTRRTWTEVLTVRDTSGISSTWSEPTTVDVQGPGNTLDVMYPNYSRFTPPSSPEHPCPIHSLSSPEHPHLTHPPSSPGYPRLTQWPSSPEHPRLTHPPTSSELPRPTHPPSSTATTFTPIKDLELTPAPTPIKETSTSRAAVISTTNKPVISEHPPRGQPTPQPTGISPTGTADINIVRHFPVSDRSDQSDDPPHLLSFRGYRNETDATSVPPHIRFPVTSHVTSESSHRVVIQTRDTAGSRELEKEGVGGGEGGSRESSPESWHSLTPHEGEETEGVPIQQVKEAAGKEGGIGKVQDGKFQPSLKEISSHMEQLTHLVERMSARFVILETQLKLVEPKTPPVSVTGDTTWTTTTLSDNHGMKNVTIAEQAALPSHHDQNTGSQPPPPLPAHSQTDAKTPAKMRSILKPPLSHHATVGRELLPSATPLNPWAAYPPRGAVNLSPHFNSSDQLSREIQSPSRGIYPRSPVKPCSVAAGSLHSTPSTPDDTRKMIESLRNRAKRTKEYLQKVNTNT